MLKRLTVSAAVVAAGLFSALGYSAIAQTNRSAPPVLPSSQLEQPTQQRSNQLSAIDRQFIIDAAQGGIAEVRLAQLALQRSNNEDVRRFAQQMIQEHTAANRELMQLAAQKGISVPETTGSRYQAAMQRLMQLSGESFDQAYMSEAGLNGHLEGTAVYQRQAMLGQDADLKAFAARTLPRVQDHLQMAGRMTGNTFAFGGDNNTPAMPGMQMNQ